MNFMKNVSNLYIWENSFTKERIQIDFTNASENDINDVCDAINSEKTYHLCTNATVGTAILTGIAMPLCVTYFIATGDKNGLITLILIGLIGCLNWKLAINSLDKTKESTKAVEETLRNANSVKVKRFKIVNFDNIK